MQLATFALTEALVTVIVADPATAVIDVGFKLSELPPGHVVRLLGLSSTTSPDGRESTQPIPVFAASAVLEMVKVNVVTWPALTVVGQNVFDKL